MEFSWKDELLLRAAFVPNRATTEGNRLPGLAEGYRHFPPEQAGEQYFEQLCAEPCVAMERFLQEREAKDKAERYAIDYRRVADTWCDSARKYCKQRNDLMWALAIALGWALSTTWALLGNF